MSGRRSNRVLKMTSSSRHKVENLADIEDVDDILNNATNGPDIILEEPAAEQRERNEEKEHHDADGFEHIDDEAFKKFPEEKKKKKSSVPVKVRGKGKRTVEIHELDPNIIPPTIEDHLNPDHTGSKLAIIGKPGTGKSTIIRSLLYEKSEIFPCAQIYSGTEDSNHAYSKFIPSTFIFNAFSQGTYMNYIKRQKAAKLHLDNPWSVCIFDDITEDERIFNLPIIKGTYKNGRHWKMLHLLSLQYALDIKPGIRTSIDGSFILRETNKRNRKTLFENYSSVIDDFNDFNDIMDTVTNDYTALYIHNRIQSNNFSDCVFWYKARTDIPDDFRFGCSESWMFHNERFNTHYVDPIGV